MHLQLYYKIETGKCRRPPFFVQTRDSHEPIYYPCGVIAPGGEVPLLLVPARFDEPMLLVLGG